MFQIPSVETVMDELAADEKNYDVRAIFIEAATALEQAGVTPREVYPVVERDRYFDDPLADAEPVEPISTFAFPLVNWGAGRYSIYVAGIKVYTSHFDSEGIYPIADWEIEAIQSQFTEDKLRADIENALMDIVREDAKQKLNRTRNAQYEDNDF